MKWKLIIGLFFFILYFPTKTYAATYYIATTGSDSNSGVLSSPWKTIAHANGIAKAGDIVYVRGGTYAQSIYWTTSGVQGSPITVSGYQNELPIFDGSGAGVSNYGYLLYMTGNWLVFNNMKIINSSGGGVGIKGTHDLASHIVVDNSYSSCGLIFGDYSTIDYMTATRCSMMNENNKSGVSGGWSSGISCARYPDYCSIKHSSVHISWGEGISTFETEHATLEDNVVIDGMANYYISDTKFTTFQRNFSYCTPGNAIANYYTQSGILIGDEKGVPIPLGASGTRYNSSDNIIVNNMVMGCTHNIGIGAGQVKNDVIANNTFVNGTKYNVLFYSNDPNSKWPYQGPGKYYNNIALQTTSGTMTIAPNYQMDLSHNLWSQTPPSGVTGPGDVIGDPLLTKKLTTDGQTTGLWFTLSPNSPAINKGISVPEVKVDYFGSTRPVGNAPDIGAHEYGGTGNSTLTPTIPIPTLPSVISPTLSSANPDLNTYKDKVTFVGDSLTVGYAYYGQDATPFATNGKTSTQMLTDFHYVLSKTPKPKVVLILGGTNDGIFSTSAYNTALANIKSMTDQAKTAGIIPLVGTLPPLGAWADQRLAGSSVSPDAWKTAIVSYNSQLRSLYPQNYVDFNAVLIDPNNQYYYDPAAGSTDGLHPGVEGYRRMRVVAAAKLDQVLGQSGTQLSISLLLHGIGKGGDNVNATTTGNMNPLHPQRTVIVDLVGTNNQTISKQGTVTFNASVGNFQGSINLGTLTSGAYTVRFSSPQFLGKVTQGITTITNGQTVIVPSQSLTTGDVNGDNLLNVLDYNNILDCFSDLGAPRNCTDATKKQMTDITDDGSVNQFDYNLFLRELSVQSGQ